MFKSKATKQREQMEKIQEKLKDYDNDDKDKMNQIGKDFLKKKEEKESSIRNKKNKKLDMSQVPACKNSDGSQRVKTNCCDSDNLSKDCNSSAGTTKHIFEMIYPDIRAAMLAVGVAGKLTDKGLGLFTKEFPETVIFSPAEAKIEHEARLKAMESLAEIKAAQKYLVGGKRRKNNKNNKKTKKNSKNKKNKNKNKKQVRKSKKI